MDRPTCESCPYWCSIGHKCHRKSPIVAIGTNRPDSDTPLPNAPWAYFPGTSSEQWCGEHPKFDRYLMTTYHAVLKKGESDAN